MNLFRDPVFVASTLILMLFLVISAAGQINSLQQNNHSLPASALNDTTKGMVIPKIKESIELDGRIEEPAWQDAKSLRLIQHKPNFGEEPSEKTEVLIGYSDEHLYLACKCYDSESPSATSFKRDYFSGDTDYFILILDTFNDNENGLAFQTTPTGLRADEAIFNDAAGNPPSDANWDGFWESSAVQTSAGWFVEMRIPFSSLRFEKEEDHVVMGLSVSRYIARENEIAVFPDIPPNWGLWSPWKPSNTEEAIFEDVEPQTPLYVTPYLLGGADWQSILNNSGTNYQKQADLTYDGGVDVKYGLSGNLTLDLTVNTDFAQVEADNQQVNLDRFPLFFPEKRRFFQERSSNFAFNFSGSNRLFYSRRIGLYDGRQARILGGARLVGRSGPWDIGVLNMQTTSEHKYGRGDTSIPSENFGVLRLRRQVFNPYSYVGSIMTSRIGREGSFNIAYGLDGIFRLTGDEYVTAKWAQTFDDEAPNRIASMDPARVLLQWERRSYRRLNYDLRYSRSGAYYRPELGFELRENYYRLGDRIGYGWIPANSRLERHRLNMIGEAFFRNEDGALETLEVGPEWEFVTTRGHNLTIGGRYWIEDLIDPFSLSDQVTIPENRHTFQEGKISYSMPSDWNLRSSIDLSAGGFYDGQRWSVRFGPTWNASKYLLVNGDYEFNKVVFPERNEKFRSHIARIRFEITPNKEYSLQTFVQYNSAIDGMVGNIRFRYNPREGNDFYLVYNENLNTDRSGLRPRPPISMARTILLKYTYTFMW